MNGRQLLLTLLALLPAVLAATRPLTVASFNIQVLGASKMGKSAVADALAEICARYDVVFIQELRQTPTDECGELTGSAICQLWDMVSAAAGEEYGMDVGARQGTTSSKEQYVTFYRKSKLSVVSAYDDGAGSATRPPRVVELLAFNQTRFTVANMHARPASASSTPPTTEDEIEELLALGDRILGNSNKAVLLLGDLNADGSYFNEDTRWAAVLDGSRFVNIVGDEVDTTVAVSDNTYDRVLASPQALSWLAAGSVSVLNLESDVDLTAVGVQGCQQPRYISDCPATALESAEEVSDHYPVQLTLNVPVADEVDDDAGSDGSDANPGSSDNSAGTGGDGDDYHPSGGVGGIIGGVVGALVAVGVAVVLYRRSKRKAVEKAPPPPMQLEMA